MWKSVRETQGLGLRVSQMREYFADTVRLVGGTDWLVE